MSCQSFKWRDSPFGQHLLCGYNLVADCPVWRSICYQNYLNKYYNLDTKELFFRLPPDCMLPQALLGQDSNVCSYVEFYYYPSSLGSHIVLDAISCALCADANNWWAQEMDSYYCHSSYTFVIQFPLKTIKSKESIKRYLVFKYIQFLI